MANSIRTCVICSEEFELSPQKPGFANRCPACSAPRPVDPRVVRQVNRQGRLQMIERQIKWLQQDKERAECIRSPSVIALREEDIQRWLKLKRQTEREMGHHGNSD